MSLSEARALATSEEVLQRLLTADLIDAAWFAPSFLAEIPAHRVQQLRHELIRRHGDLKSVAGEGERWLVTLERATVPVRLALDAAGRISGLLLEAPLAV